MTTGVLPAQALRRLIADGMIAADPALQRRRVVAGREHRPVVVALEKQRAESAECGDDVWRWPADVRQQAQPGVAVLEDELHRFAGVVRHRKRLNFKLANGKRTVAIDDSQIKFGINLPACSPRAMCHPDRQTELSRQAENTIYVVAMLMRDQNAGKIGWCASKAQHAGYGIT